MGGRLRLLVRSGSPTHLLLAAVAAGALIGALVPEAGERLSHGVDPLVLLMVGALFFTVRFEGWGSLRRAPRTVLLALGVNFVLIPALAYVLTLLLVPQEAIRLGVFIYCLFPCTDWFLGFIRMACGDTATGAALIPIQLTLQLLLYPVWLSVLTGTQIEASLAQIGPALLQWFVLPAAVAIVLRGALWAVLRCAPRVASRAGHRIGHRAAEFRQDRIIAVADRAIPFIVAALIVCLFAAHIGTMLANLSSLVRVLLAVVLFFFVVYELSEALSRLFRLGYADRVVLTMATAARNAPLMLAVTAIALPDQPLVTAAVVLGMLVEFPLLTALTYLLRRAQRGGGEARAPVLLA